jgi:hypothetical protein
MSRAWESLGRRVPGAYHAYLNPNAHEVVRACRAGIGVGLIQVRFGGVSYLGDRPWTIELPPDVIRSRANDDEDKSVSVWVVSDRESVDGDPLRDLLDEARDMVHGDVGRILLIVDLSASVDLPPTTERGDDVLQGLADDPGPLTTVEDPAIEAIIQRIEARSASYPRDGILVADSLTICPMSLPDRNVLDPFFWAASRLREPTRSVPLLLILDGAASIQLGVEERTRIRVGLLDIGELTIYYLGSTEIVVEAESALSKSSSRSRPRLVGPILDFAPKGAVALLLAYGPVLDLEDFESNDWKGRFRLLNPDEFAMADPVTTIDRAFREVFAD